MHTDTTLKIIGIAAAVYIAYEQLPNCDFFPYQDSGRLAECFFLYNSTDTGLTYLAQTDFWDTNTVVHYQMEFVKPASQVINGHSWNPNVDANERVYFPVYEAYFDKPITVDGTFYVGGSGFNNRPVPPFQDFFSNPMYQHPMTYYCAERVNQASPGDCPNLFGGWNSNLDRIQQFAFPFPELVEEETELDTSLVRCTYLGQYSTLCFFPILAAPDTIPPHNDTCIGATGLRILDLSEHVATLTWDQTGSDASLWQIAVIPDDTTFAIPPDSGDIRTFSSNLATIGNLAPKWYTAYLRTVCNDTLFSTWSDTVIFNLTPTPPDTTQHEEGLVTPIDRLTFLTPNPAGNTVSVSSSFLISSIDIIAANGHTSASYTANANSITIDLTNLAAGSYFVHIHTISGTTTKKLVKK